MRATLLSRPTARTEFNTAAWICLSIHEILLAFSQMHVPLERADWCDSVMGYKLQRGVLLLTHGVLTRCIIVIRRLLANANTVFSSRVHLSRQSNFCIKKCHATFNWSCELEYHAICQVFRATVCQVSLQYVHSWTDGKLRSESFETRCIFVFIFSVSTSVRIRVLYSILSFF